MINNSVQTSNLNNQFTVTSTVHFYTYVDDYNATKFWKSSRSHFAVNHRCRGCVLNHLFRRRSQKTYSKLCINDFCDENPPLTGGFSSQRASNTEYVSIWWRHHVVDLANFWGIDEFTQDDAMTYGTVLHITTPWWP